MFLLNVLLDFKDGSQKQLTVFFENDTIEITEEDVFDKIFLFISKYNLSKLLSISCECAEENTIKTIKFPTYIDSFDFNM
jgi:hypothetical protein